MSTQQKGRTRKAISLIESSYLIDVSYTNEFMETPLHLACANNLVDLVNCLLANDANVNAPNKFQVTPLHIATRMGCIQIVRLLLKKGKASPNLCSKYGFNALTIACAVNNIKHSTITYKNIVP